MFESAELGHKISKEVWKKEIPGLREGLLDAQLDLFQAKKFPVIILVAGVDCAGKGGQCETECAKGATCDVNCPSEDCKPAPKKSGKK